MSNLPAWRPIYDGLDVRVAALATWEDAVEFVATVSAQLDGGTTTIRFIRGDAALKFVGDTGDTLRSFAEEAGVAYATLRVDVATAAAFPADRVLRRTDVPWGVYQTLAGDPDRDAKLARLIEAADGAPTVAEARALRASLVESAENVEARRQAADSAHARPAHVTQRHGATGTTEEAYDSDAHDKWIKVERAKDIDAVEQEANAGHEPEPVTEVRQPGPHVRPATPDELLQDLDAIALDVEALPTFSAESSGLTIRQANEFHRLLARIGKAVDERS